MPDENGRATNEELAEEARKWVSGELKPTDAGWEDAPYAVPRHQEAQQISIRLPKVMVAILKEFARRQDVGYQTLMKRWLDDRIRHERDKLCGSLVRYSKEFLMGCHRALTALSCTKCGKEIKERGLHRIYEAEVQDGGLRRAAVCLECAWEMEKDKPQSMGCKLRVPDEALDIVVEMQQVMVASSEEGGPGLATEFVTKIERIKGVTVTANVFDVVTFDGHAFSVSDQEILTFRKDS